MKELATLLCIPLGQWVSNQSQVLLYVLRVVVAGLRHGSLPAIRSASGRQANDRLTRRKEAMGLGSISISKLLIILVVILLLFGAGKLRHLGADLGGAVKGFRAAMKEGDKPAGKAGEAGGGEDRG